MIWKHLQTSRGLYVADINKVHDRYLIHDLLYGYYVIELLFIFIYFVYIARLPKM